MEKKEKKEKKVFVEPELVKHEDKLDEVTMGNGGTGTAMPQVSG